MQRWLVPAAFLALGLLVHPVFPHFQSPNELTRWVAVAAVVDHGSLDVTPLLPLLAPGFEDLSVRDGRTYSNKAPGSALLALPGYLAARPVTGPPAAGTMRPQLSAMRFVASTVPAALLAWFVAWAAARLGAPAEHVPIVAGSLLFATPVLAYGLLLFSHVLVAASLFAAWALLFVPGGEGRAGSREFLAGALLGVAVLAEYPAVVPAAVLFALAAWRERPARILRIVAGGSPAALLLMAYDTVCFGGPFALSSGFERFAQFQTLATGGVFGVGWPSPSILGRLLGDPGKGLLVLSPFLLLVPSALREASRRMPTRAAAGLILTPLVTVLFYGGYPNWHGGWTVGARYLVSALPFLVFPLVFRRRRAVDDVLLGASLGAVVPTALVFPFVPPELFVPWASFAWPLLGRGLVAPNLLHLVWAPFAVVAPFLLVAGLFLRLLGPRRALLATAGVLLAFGAGALFLRRFPPDLSARIQRAYIEEAYFERAGALERDLPGALKALPRLEARLDSDRALGPSPWPFLPETASGAAAPRETPLPEH